MSELTERLKGNKEWNKRTEKKKECPVSHFTQERKYWKYAVFTWEKD